MENLDLFYRTFEAYKKEISADPESAKFCRISKRQSDIENESLNIIFSTVDIDESWVNAIEKAKREFSLTKRGRAHIKELDAYIQETFQITFGNRIRRQIEAYVPIYIACGGTENEALDDILAKKVLRKLESQNPVYVKSKSEELIGKLNEVFGDGNMPVCEAYIKKLANNA